MLICLKLYSNGIWRIFIFDFWVWCSLVGWLFVSSFVCLFVRLLRLRCNHCRVKPLLTLYPLLHIKCAIFTDVRCLFRWMNIKYSRYFVVKCCVTLHMCARQNITHFIFFRSRSLCPQSITIRDNWYRCYVFHFDLALCFCFAPQQRVCAKCEVNLCCWLDLHWQHTFKRIGNHLGAKCEPLHLH